MCKPKDQTAAVSRTQMTPRKDIPFMIRTPCHHCVLCSTCNANVVSFLHNIMRCVLLPGMISFQKNADNYFLRVMCKNHGCMSTEGLVSVKQSLMFMYMLVLSCLIRVLLLITKK